MIGIDIVDVNRFADMCELAGDGFMNKVFLKEEISYIKTMFPEDNQMLRFASIYAIKEAVIKAMSSTFGIIKPWDVEVRHLWDGRPTVRLHGLEMDDLHVSASHCITFVVGVAVYVPRDT